MTALHSALYAGTVVHHRLRPRRHRLRYGVFYLLLDLDEIETLAKSLRLFSLRRLGLVSFRTSDHGDGSGVALRQQVEKHLRATGMAPDGGPIRLLTLPRLFGYAFNPISVYFCYRRTGALAAVLYEVTNTFGDRHSYLVPVAPADDATIRQQCAKTLHVSPFLDMAMRYTFRLTSPAKHLGLRVTGHDEAGPLIVATLRATRRELTDGALAKALFAYPLLTLKVIAAIHWQALLLWLKGLRVRPRPAPPRCPLTVGRSFVPPPTAKTPRANASEIRHDVAA